MALGANFVEQELKTSIVKVSSYDNKNLQGTFFNPYYNSEKVFTNLMQLILFIDGLQDEIKYPERMMEKRTFKPAVTNAKMFQTEDGVAVNEVIATFRINIFFRQNASWQGNVIWIEKNLSSGFRSALELLLLMDSVLG